MSTETGYQVFLSYYHPHDELPAAEIARRLRDEQRMEVWLHAWSVIPGRDTQEEQENGLARSHACAVLVGGEGVRGLQRLEVRASIARRVEAEGSSFPVIPVFLPDCPAEVEATLPDFLQLYEPVRFAGLDDEDALHRLVCGIQGEPPGEEKPAAIPCPYPGLEPFREGMARYFFGREDEIADLQKRLDANPFVLVMGPSGSGKSSLVLAGLIPRLWGTEADPSPYLIHTLTPGREPLQSLAMVFVPEPGDPRRKQLALDLAQDRHELSRAIQAELRQQPAHFHRMLLVVDQFEEVFTQCDDAAQRDAFIQNLLYACGGADGAAKMVLTLRSDFFTPCYDYDPLVDPRRLAPVQRLRGERLRWAIEGSARAAGLLLQRGLADTLLDDAGDEPGILPLVQYTLRELFDRRSGRWLTMDAYHALGDEVDPELGGVKGVIAARAEAALAKLQADPKFRPEQVEPIVRRILLRLVQVGENSPPTRQQVAWHEFFWASDTEAQRALLEEGLRLLIQERLLTSDKDENDVVQVNLAHEVIIKVWKRLATWVNEGMEDLLTRRRVEEAAREWDRAEQDESLLYRGVQLQKALEWQQRRI
jgi:energy-coupling factor transporter ATP-binding protein EcfA2